MYKSRAERAALKVMARVLRGELSQGDIRELSTPSHRTYAAIAWLLRHPGGRLDENLYVLGAFRTILEEIAGVPGNFVEHSKTAGLHTSKGAHEPGVPRVMVMSADRTRWGGRASYATRLARVVQLTPPEELLELIPPILPPKDKDYCLVKGLADLVWANGAEIAKEVHGELGKRLRAL